jgi:deoxycytidylate deaminase
VKKQILLYIPVLHAGYERLLERHAPGAEVLLLGESFQKSYPMLGKEIRALPPERVLHYLLAGGRVGNARLVEEWDLPHAIDGTELVIPDEEMMRDLVERHRLADRARVEFEPTFLRWDREWSRTGRPAEYDGRVTADEYAVAMQRLARAAATHSSDWWRQVGAVAARDGLVLDVAYNHHLPSEYTPYIDGDPRNAFSRGVAVELSTALHAEATIVARAARHGRSLARADIHVTTFPCPTCARMIAEAGFARCYFAGPYSLLGGSEVLRQAGVALYFVESVATNS